MTNTPKASFSQKKPVTKSSQLPLSLTREFDLLADARHHDPFSVLGRREWQSDDRLMASFTVYAPYTQKLFVSLNEQQSAEMTLIDERGFFSWQGYADLLPYHPAISLSGDHNNAHDWWVYPYTFLPMIDEAELQKLHSTNYHLAYQILGAKAIDYQGIAGVRFSVWAPNATRVSVVGDFNQWDGRIHPMRSRGFSGVWELFIPGMEVGDLYKFELRTQTGDICLKVDPYGYYYEIRPDTASIIWPQEQYQWKDQSWLAFRDQQNWLKRPVSIYEVHLGSWRRDADNQPFSYRELAHDLLAYVKDMQFTHVQLMPVTEFPFDGSWGYQVTGYFASTSRFGNPDDFRYFVDQFHQAGIGVLLDWVPAHFPRDQHGLARFDGTALYEHEDPRLGEHRDWGTLIFNYGRQEVKNFLLSSAYFWMKEFHIDGLRVDAVASMLYLDYSKEEGEWLPNRYGGNENLEAIDFLKNLNMLIHDHFPGGLMIAEESTAWPQVSRPVYLGGLGFTMKWNMGWMNDTLSYFEHDGIHRKYHHNNLTFSLLYAFTENFVLPLSHDEVVHGKRSILNKMPGDGWQQFANLRLLYSYQYAHPGKKLMFMGGEFGQGSEWSEAEQLHWYLLEHALQLGAQTMVRDLNKTYSQQAAFYLQDFNGDGFSWIDCNDSEQSVLSFFRTDGEDYIICVFNFTSVVRESYQLGVPEYGTYEEIFNSDSKFYGGSNVSNGTDIHCHSESVQGQPFSLTITLPPLGGIYLKRKR